MENYKKLLTDISEAGYIRPAARDNMPSVRLLHSKSLTFNFKDGLPIVTGKYVPFYSILAELICFMRGVTDVRVFSELGCNVWWDNAYKWNVVERGDEALISKTNYKLGVDNKGTEIHSSFYDLGRIYSAQWRDYKGVVRNEIIVKDQLVDLIDGIINTPYSNYHVLTAWNPVEMNGVSTAQPNCHVYFQATVVPFHSHAPRFDVLTSISADNLVEGGYSPTNLLMTHLTQRSADMFLGVPFNVTSYSLFTILLGIFTNTLPIEFNWHGVNCHIYDDHFDQVRQYVDNEVHQLPMLDIKDIFKLSDLNKLNTLADLKHHFKLEYYNHSGRIAAPLSVGL